MLWGAIKHLPGLWISPVVAIPPQRCKHSLIHYFTRRGINAIIRPIDLPEDLRLVKPYSTYSQNLRPTAGIGTGFHEKFWPHNLIHAGVGVNQGYTIPCLCGTPRARRH